MNSWFCKILWVIFSTDVVFDSQVLVLVLVSKTRVYFIVLLFCCFVADDVEMEKWVKLGQLLYDRHSCTMLNSTVDVSDDRIGD